MHRQKAKEKVTIVGSGNWGSAIAKIVGRNVLTSDEFEDEVRMWVFQEQVNGKNLTDIINTQHENVKYLPVRLPQTPGLSAYNPAARRPSLSRTNFVLAQGIKFTPNVIADPDLTHACTGSTLLIFVLPHQFLGYATAARRHSPTIATDVAAAVAVAAALTLLRAPILVASGIAATLCGIAASLCGIAATLCRLSPHGWWTLLCARRICPKMNTVAKGCRAISLIKGIEFNDRGPILISNMIKVRPSESAPPHATTRRHTPAPTSELRARLRLCTPLCTPAARAAPRTLIVGGCPPHGLPLYRRPWAAWMCPY